MFDPTGTLAVPDQVLERHIEHKNAPLTQVVERFCALWIGAMIHHDHSPVPADALSRALLLISHFPTNTVDAPFECVGPGQPGTCDGKEAMSASVNCTDAANIQS
jgi:hypothetical protein